MTSVRMEIAPANVNSFKSIFNSVDTIIDTITFECYSDRVEFNALDKSSTVFISCVMSADYFKSYECEEEDRFNINATDLKKILKSCKDELTLEFDNEYVTFRSLSKQFKVNQVLDDLNTPKPPHMEYFVEFEVPIKYLKDVVKDIELFAKDVTINSSSFQVSFSSGGHGGEFIDTCTFDNELKAEKVKLSTEKLMTCLGADKVSDTMKLEIESDMPVLLTQEADGIRLMYMIAPRVDVSE